MAASAIGALRVTLGIDTAAFTDGLNAAQKRMSATGKNLQAIGGKIATAGAGMSAAISLPFAALVKSSIPAAVESKQALAQVTAALASMGTASGRSVEQLQAQAGALQSLSNFDDDDILKSVTANLLTFGNVSGEVFDRAQLAAVNLSARMGTDLQSAALMVGKALNDPVKGLAALGRAGIQFTAEQKEQIKGMVAAGNAAGAQSIMLRELERQFGGAAKAQRDATPDAAMQEQWRTLQENIGAVALKVMPPLLDVITRAASAFNNLDPTVQTFIIGAAAITAALGPVTIGIGGMVSAFGLVIPALAPVATFLTAVLIPAAIATAPVWAPIAAAVGLAAGAFALLIKYQPQIDAFGEAVVGRMKALYVGVKTWLVDKLNSVWGWVGGKVKAVGDAFFQLYDRVVGHSYIPDMVDEVGEHVGRLDTNMVAPILAATGKAGDAFAELRGKVRGILDELFPEEATVRGLQEKLSAIDEALANKLINPATWAAARARMIDQLYAAQDAATKATGRPTSVVDSAPDIGGVPSGRDTQDEIKKTGDVIAETWGKATAANDNLVQSFAGLARDIVGSLGTLAGNIKSGDWLGALSSVLDVIGQVSGIIKGTGTPATRTYSVGSTPGFATGGSFQVKGMRGVDANMLSLNGQPIARVSHGEMVGVGRGGGGPAVVQLVVGEGQMFEPRVASISGGVSIETVRGGNKIAASRQRQALG